MGIQTDSKSIRQEYRRRGRHALIFFAVSAVLAVASLLVAEHLRRLGCEAEPLFVLIIGLPPALFLLIPPCFTLAHRAKFKRAVAKLPPKVVSALDHELASPFRRFENIHVDCTKHYLVHLREQFCVIPYIDIVWIYRHAQTTYAGTNDLLCVVTAMHQKFLIASTKDFNNVKRGLQEKDDLIALLKEIKPDILIGFTPENEQLAEQRILIH